MQTTLFSNIQLHTYRQVGHKLNLKAQSDCDCGYAPIPEDLLMSPLSIPNTYFLELTPYCNNRCAGCGNSFVVTRPQKFDKPLRLDHWEEIIDQIAHYAKSIKITGGEPTLHPRFEQIVQKIQRRNIAFSIFTNGRWNSPERIIGLLKETSQKVGVLISLHGANAEAHEAFTKVKNSFHETIKNIQRAVESGLTVSTNTIFTRYNAHQVDALIALSQSLGVEFAIFNRYVGRCLPHVELPLSELKRTIQTVERFRQKGYPVKFGTCIPLCFITTSSTGCLSGTTFCTIDPWGGVRPCNHAPQIAGNLLTESIEIIWQSEIMQAWRNGIPDECINCGAFTVCHGGCRADTVLKGKRQDVLMQTSIYS